MMDKLQLSAVTGTDVTLSGAEAASMLSRLRESGFIDVLGEHLRHSGFVERDVLVLRDMLVYGNAGRENDDRAAAILAEVKRLARKVEQSLGIDEKTGWVR